MAETQKEKIMRVLGVSSAEADEILKSDKEIDKGIKQPFDLSADAEKIAKSFARCTDRKKPIILDNKPRDRKANPTKGGIIAEIAEFLEKNSQFAVENLEITNKERQIAFKISENSFEITLIQKRKPKS